MWKIFVLFVCLILAYCSCSRNKEADFIEVTGTIEAKEIMIRAKVSGEIKAVRVDEGSIVRKGDTLVIFDNTQFLLQLKQAKSTEEFALSQYTLVKKGARREDISQAEALLMKAESDYNLVRANYERLSKLKESQSIPEKSFDEISAQLKSSEANLLVAKENLNKIRSVFRAEEIQQAKANFEKAKAFRQLVEKNLSDCYLLSPIDGIVLNKYFETSEFVTLSAPILSIANLDTIEMMVYIPEGDIGKVLYGQRAEIYIDSYPGRKFLGKVIYISQQAEFTPKNVQTKDERTRLVYGVKLQIKNENNILKPGIPADARIFIGKLTSE